VQNNWIAEGVGEGALTVGLGEAGEGEGTVGGGRYAGGNVACSPSRNVEGDAKLVGGVWVGRRGNIGPNNLGRILGAGDQVDVRGAIRQRCLQLLDQPGEGATGGT